MFKHTISAMDACVTPPSNHLKCLRHLQEALDCLRADDGDAVTAARIEHAMDDLRQRLAAQGIDPEK